MHDQTVAADDDRAAQAILHAAIGAFVGGLVGGLAGIAARVAMRIFAERTQPTVSFTVEGSMMIIVMGGLFGLAMGIVYVALRAWLPGPTLVKGLLFGSALVVAVVAPVILTQPGEAGPDPVLGVVLFSGLALAFGLLLAVGMALIDGRIRQIGTVSRAVLTFALGGGVVGLAMIVPAVIGTYASAIGRLVR